MPVAAGKVQGKFGLAAGRLGWHTGGVKRALAGLALFVISHAPACHAADALGGCAIEQSHLNLAPPLDAEEMRRFAQGIPPRVRLFPFVSYDSYTGFFCFRCGEHSGRVNHRNCPYLQLNLTENVKFTAAEVLVPAEAQGMRVLRGPNGELQQVVNMKDCYFISQDKDVIVSERYYVYDCETTPEGRMKVLPEAVCLSRLEIRELAPDPAKGMRTFKAQVFGEKQGTLTFLYDFQETKGRVQVMVHQYKGDQISPETLTLQNSFQRVFWKEGPGYRQILKVEVRQPDGSLQLVEHTIASWRVAKDGSRKLADTQKLVAPPERDEGDAVH